MKTVNTYRGIRKIDLENKLIEINGGEMVSYSSIEMKNIEGANYFIHMIGENAGVAVTQESYKELTAISEEQKQENLREQAIANLNSEGYGE